MVLGIESYALVINLADWARAPTELRMPATFLCGKNRWESVGTGIALGLITELENL